MAHPERKTVRFTQIVERSGEPEVHTLWLPPDKDPELKRAQKTHRVMTVTRSATGGKTDVGFVGFDPAEGKPGQFLIFPKSLKAFEGARVVGIKFDLVTQPKLASASALKRTITARPSHRTHKAKTSRGSESEEPPPSAALADKNEGGTNVVSFEPSPDSVRTPDESRPAHHAEAQPTRASPRHSVDAGLLREVRAALKDLQRGKSVAAYKRLERAVEKAEQG